MHDIFDESEQEFADRIFILGNGKSQEALLENLDQFHDTRILFNLIMEVYTMDGNLPRKVVMKAKQLAKDIPAEERLKGLPDGNTITVYRADEWRQPTFERLVKCAPSWTINKNIAIWFAYRRYKMFIDEGAEPDSPPRAIWKGEIERDRIIAYLTDRGEYEVLQHRNVRNLEMLPDPTPEEVEEAFAEEARRRKEREKQLIETAKD